MKGAPHERPFWDQVVSDQQRWEARAALRAHQACSGSACNTGADLRGLDRFDADGSARRWIEAGWTARDADLALERRALASQAAGQIQGVERSRRLGEERRQGGGRAGGGFKHVGVAVPFERSFGLEAETVAQRNPWLSEALQRCRFGGNLVTESFVRRIVEQEGQRLALFGTIKLPHGGCNLWILAHGDINRRGDGAYTFVVLDERPVRFEQWVPFSSSPSGSYGGWSFAHRLDGTRTSSFAGLNDGYDIDVDLNAPGDPVQSLSGFLGSSSSNDDLQDSRSLDAIEEGTPIALDILYDFQVIGTLPGELRSSHLGRLAFSHTDNVDLGYHLDYIRSARNAGIERVQLHVVMTVDWELQLAFEPRFPMGLSLLLDEGGAAELHVDPMVAADVPDCEVVASLFRMLWRVLDSKLDAHYPDLSSSSSSIITLREAIGELLRDALTELDAGMVHAYCEGQL